MKKNDTLLYPTIFTKENDGGYAVSSPNIPGMHTEGDNFEEAAYWAVDAIATMLDGEAKYPEIQDPSNWPLKENQRVVVISVDMKRWLFEKAQEAQAKTVRRTITVPQSLNDLAKAEGVNVSKIATQALRRALKLKEA